MLNFYQIVRDNLNFNRFQYKDTVCLEYTCPIDADQIGIFSKNDVVVYVLSGKKTYKTLDGEWTINQGEALYLKKGAEVINQYFDDEYCMLGFFLSDDLICETYKEARTNMQLNCLDEAVDFTGKQVPSSDYLDGYFHSMLTYFRGENRPPDHIMVLKLKELLINLMDTDSQLTTYFNCLANQDRPSIKEIMEKNFCFNLKLEDYAELCHCSLSTFKREFSKIFNESPGKWILQRRLKHAANMIAGSTMNVTQIAFESGFEDLSHFSRTFKNMTGYSPSEYKKSLVEA
ncbi:helix-turn-helix domain-containing protein [Marinigracilibium pacificum]|uniref:AraC family transcriptional regulator n=1 Tax=Marinigracilibium pacificum TaxID=2729599 RepID=A0A848IW71_9BACT|nr:helix-turn-helix domain-containing protein [Marinigracilibium pacificum]NMM47936.1 AraC family transcriptional regulator [Marinigracilibium pacificum]